MARTQRKGRACCTVSSHRRFGQRYFKLCFLPKRLLTALSLVYNTPVFEPHMTLVAGLPFETDIHTLPFVVQNALQMWRLENQSTMRLTFLETGHKEDVYYQSLFMHVKLSEQLQSLRAIVQRELCWNQMAAPSREYMPHMSLLYSSKVTAAQKADLVERMKGKSVLQCSNDEAKLSGLLDFEVSVLYSIIRCADLTLQALELCIVRSKKGVDTWSLYAHTGDPVLRCCICWFY